MTISVGVFVEILLMPLLRLEEAFCLGEGTNRTGKPTVARLSVFLKNMEKVCSGLKSA